MTVYLERPPWGPFLEFLAKIWDFSEFFSNFSQSFEKILKRSQSLSQKLTKIEIKSNFIYIKIIFSQSFGEKGFQIWKGPSDPRPWNLWFQDSEIWDPLLRSENPFSILRSEKIQEKPTPVALSWTFSDSLDLEGLKYQTWNPWFQDLRSEASTQDPKSMDPWRSCVPGSRIWDLVTLFRIFLNPLGSQRSRKALSDWGFQKRLSESSSDRSLPQINLISADSWTLLGSKTAEV
jgi:hypothetical protein